MAERPDLYAVTEADFEQRVLAASAQKPVLVDFWAAWCGPCRAVVPLLEQVLDQFPGQLAVAKVDTDAEAALAARYAIRSLPTLAVFRHGKLAEQLVGAHPLHTLSALVSRHLVRPSESLAREAQRARAEGALEDAERLYAEAIRLDPEHYALFPEYAAVLIDRAQLEAAAAILERIPARADSEAAGVQQARLRFARLAAGSPGEAVLKAEMEAGSTEPETRFQWAVRQLVAGDHRGALETLLGLVRTHRGWNEGAPRRLMLDVFAMLPEGDPLVREFRSLLARALN